MKKINSLLVADSILSLLQTRYLSDNDMFIRNYINGREEGFTIVSRKEGRLLEISFAEARNSDQIIVITNEVDDNTHYFSTIDEAVGFIQIKLNEE